MGSAVGMIGGFASSAAKIGAGAYQIATARQYEEIANAQAAAQRAAGAAQAAAAEGQAASYREQAKIAERQAANEQLKGEQQASRRYRLLADDIGSTYANWAGNGLSVGGGGTFDSILRSQRREAREDVATINENTSMNVWTYLANAENMKISARNSQRYGSAAMRAADISAAATQMEGVYNRQNAYWNGIFNTVGAVGEAVGGFGMMGQAGSI